MQIIYFFVQEVQIDSELSYIASRDALLAIATFNEIKLWDMAKEEELLSYREVQKLSRRWISEKLESF